MLPRRHLQLVVTILVAMSMVAFTPRLQRPHLRLSCGSTEDTTLSGSQRFTDDSSRLPDLKAGYEANGVPLPQYLKLISDVSGRRTITEFQIYDSFRTTNGKTVQIAPLARGKPRPALSKLYTRDSLAREQVFAGGCGQV